MEPESAPAFFVPLGDPDKQEAAYEELARFARSEVPSAGHRIYSITWMHDGIAWTATVGETLRGVERKPGTRKGKKIIRERHVSDQAAVLAIFAGRPYFVVTNVGFNGGPRGSGWANPFMAGFIKSVVHFSRPA